MRRSTRDIIGITVLAGFIALSVRITVAFWDPDHPSPERAMVLFFGWCLAMMTVFFTVVFVWTRLSRPSGGSPTSPPDVPMEPSPAGFPLGPRVPAPLVAHAIPPKESDA